MRELLISEIAMIAGGESPDAGKAPTPIKTWPSPTGKIGDGVKEALERTGGDIVESMKDRAAGYPEFLGKDTLVGGTINSIKDGFKDAVESTARQIEIIYTPQY